MGGNFLELVSDREQRERCPVPTSSTKQIIEMEHRELTANVIELGESR